MKFTPHPEYKYLLKQANALVGVINSLEHQRDSLTELLKTERRKKRPVSQQELDSERAANERLTNELETLRARKQ